MINSRSHSGYIMISTLMVIGLAATVVTLIALRGSLFAPYAQTAVARQQARQLALGGVACAMGQLVRLPEQKKDTKEKKGNHEVEEAQELLRTLLPTINRWQEIKLTNYECISVFGI